LLRRQLRDHRSQRRSTALRRRIPPDDRRVLRRKPCRKNGGFSLTGGCLHSPQRHRGSQVLPAASPIGHRNQRR